MLSILLTLAAVFGVLNYRTLRLPNTIGVLVISLAVSLVMLAADPFIPRYDLQAISRALVGSVNLPQVLLDGALSFLLFAGAIQADLGELWARKLVVLALALLGTMLETVATKQDVDLLRRDVDMFRSSLQTEIGQVRSTLQAEIGQVRSTLQAEIGQVRIAVAEGKVWTVSVGATIVAVLAAMKYFG